MVRQSMVLSDGVFYSLLAAEINAAKEPSALIFVHGYNCTFINAARRTAQLSFDLGFNGPAILYSWPSVGSPMAYPVDETNVQWAIPHFKDFLTTLTALPGIQHLHIIAHSMGNRLVSHALSELADQGVNLPVAHHAILTAPDIDRETFLQLAPNVSRAAQRVTVYVSARDKALRASRKFHGYPRLGEIGAPCAGVDVIEASHLNTDFLGHSYYGSNRSVISDMFYLIRNGLAPDDRAGMRPVSTGDGCYFEFRP